MRRGFCGQVWRGEATAPGDVEGFTVGPAEWLRRPRKGFKQGRG